MKIEISTTTDLDSIRYALQCELSTKQLAQFVMDLGDKLTESEEYYRLLKQKLAKIKME